MITPPLKVKVNSGYYLCVKKYFEKKIGITMWQTFNYIMLMLILIFLFLMLSIIL